MLIAVAAAVGYFTGNLPAPFEDWMLFTAAGVITLLLVVVPLWVWAAHFYTITTKRVIEHSGLFSRSRREVSHVRGYSITVRRGILQRIWGTGNLILDDAAGPPLIIKNIPSYALVHEVLVDQVEVGQILAHRDAQGATPTA